MPYTILVWSYVFPVCLVRVLKIQLRNLKESIQAAQLRVAELEGTLNLKEQPQSTSGEKLIVAQPTTNTGYDDDTENLSDVIGTLSIADDGATRYHGETASSEVNDLSNFLYVRIFLTFYE